MERVNVSATLKRDNKHESLLIAGGNRVAVR